MPNDFTPTLQLGFLPDRDTQPLVEKMFQQLDSRKKEGDNHDLAFDLLSSMLALRSYDKFSIYVKRLKPTERDCLSTILARHRGTFIRREGRNTYSINPEIGRTFVIDQAEKTLIQRVEGPYVRFSNPQSIQSLDAVSTINGSRGAILTLKSVGSILHALANNQHLPKRFDELEPIALTPEIAELSRELRSKITFILKKHYTAPAFLHEDDNLHDYTLFCEQLTSFKFTEWLVVQLRDFFREHGLKIVAFPSHIRLGAQDNYRTEILPGLSLQTELERRSGHVAA